MTCIIDIRSNRRRSAGLVAGLVLAIVLVSGAFVGSASAQPHRDDHRGWDHRGGGGGPGPWNGGGGGYYAPPPVVYGGPVYYPPPVVYGPSVGIALPGVSIGIQ